MKTKAEIINETVEYYSEDVNRRALTPAKEDGSTSSGCMYLTPDKQMCAVGRCFTEEGLHEWGDYPSYFTCDMVDSFKEEYQIDDFCFWKDLQSLHDNNNNWNEEGLTGQGKEYVQYLLKTYA